MFERILRLSTTLCQTVVYATVRRLCDTVVARSVLAFFYNLPTAPFWSSSTKQLPEGANKK